MGRNITITAVLVDRVSPSSKSMGSSFKALSKDVDAAQKRMAVLEDRYRSIVKTQAQAKTGMTEFAKKVREATKTFEEHGDAIDGISLSGARGEYQRLQDTLQRLREEAGQTKKEMDALGYGGGGGWQTNQAEAGADHVAKGRSPQGEQVYFMTGAGASSGAVQYGGNGTSGGSLSAIGSGLLEVAGDFLTSGGEGVTTVIGSVLKVLPGIFEAMGEPFEARDNALMSYRDTRIDAENRRMQMDMALGADNEAYLESLGVEGASDINKTIREYYSGLEKERNRIRREHEAAAYQSIQENNITDPAKMARILKEARIAAEGEYNKTPEAIHEADSQKLLIDNVTLMLMDDRAQWANEYMLQDARANSLDEIREGRIHHALGGGRNYSMMQMPDGEYVYVEKRNRAPLSKEMDGRQYVPMPDGTGIYITDEGGSFINYLEEIPAAMERAGETFNNTLKAIHHAFATYPLFYIQEKPTLVFGEELFDGMGGLGGNSHGRLGLPLLGTVQSGGLPKGAYGLSYVPYNNYPALLHEGEQVLTASEARARRTPAPITITGNNFTVREEADVYKIAQELASQMRWAQMLS